MENQEIYKLLADSTTELICLHQPDGTYTYLTPSVKRILGYDNQELLGTDPYELFHPDDRQVIREQSHKEVLKGNDYLDMEYRIRKKNGEYIWFNTYTDTIKNENGEVEQLVTRSRDVTSRKQAELALKKSEKKLRELLATKDKFFSIISHDLRSPFNTFSGFLSLLKQKIRDGELEKSREIIDTMEKVSEDTLNLLTNLLEWSRTQTDSIRFEPEAMPLSTTCKLVSSLFDYPVHQKHLVLECRLDNQLMVRADKNMLESILRNLISNAIKYSNPGGTIMISGKKKGDRAEVTITDQGTGMEKEELDRLFRLEKSISKPGTAQETGSGLGLILIREFVKKHDSELHISSRPGKGSSFTFTLPLA